MNISERMRRMPAKMASVLAAILPEAKKAARVTAILDKLGLEDQRHMLPEDLSGGEDQRGAIGRALISGARII